MSRESKDSICNPISTYRIQFNKNFTFRDFENIISYLDKLGIRTIYASPIFEATPGSMHGYDGTDPNKINPEIGSEQQLINISQILKKKNIYWLQDIVPNHMAYHENNKWMMDVLEKGPASEYSKYFDIDWNHPDFPGRIMVPFPGSSLEQVLKEKIPGGKYYLLCPWQETDKRINYRRFFLVNGLICINIQHEKVFEKYHSLIKKLSDIGVFHGLRVDHIDGLFDPDKYLDDLRKLAGDRSYIVVEKILEPGENMPANWPVQGNSGYDFIGMVNNLFTNRSSEFELTALYYDLTGDSVPVEQQVIEKKSFILNSHMAGELDNLIRLYKEVGLAGNGTFNDNDIKRSIAEYLVHCPVYRYYGDDFPVMEQDIGKDKQKIKKFYSRCMQFTGPLMAKGVEDTLMYTYNRFIGHSEVGESAELFGYSIMEFHDMMKYRNKHWPYSINGTSTHDTKRGEDVRARLNALTDFYKEWTELVTIWKKENQILKKNGAPDNNDEYFIYQTLTGSHPMMPPEGESPEEEQKYPDRIAEYLQKALREAKRQTDWSEPDIQYEEATIHFAHKLIEKDSLFSKTFRPFLHKLCDYGMINSFGQLVLKFTCPGIPDIYQGTELWDLSLVDPDNRRPVDYSMRMKMISENKPLSELWKIRCNGQIKLMLLHHLLYIRNHFNEVFSKGEYLPLQTEGEFRENVIAFLRRDKDKCILVAVPLNFAVINQFNQFSAEIPKAQWKDTKIILPPGMEPTWEDLLNGSKIESSGEIYINEILKEFPVAVFNSLTSRA